MLVIYVVGFWFFMAMTFLFVGEYRNLKHENVKLKNEIRRLNAEIRRLDY